MPLPRRLRAHQYRQGAALVEPQLGELVGRKAGLLDIDSVAEPAMAAARSRLGAPRCEAGEVGRGKRLIHVAGEFAAVVIEAERGLVRHCLGFDEIAPAQLLRRHTELSGGVVDQPLDGIGGLGPAGAAVGIDRHRVSEHAFNADMDRGDRVDAAVHKRPRGGGDLGSEVR